MKNTLVHFWQDISRLALSRGAAQLAFNALFALVPVIALSVQLSLWVLPDSQKIAGDLLVLILPPSMDQSWLVQWFESARSFSAIGFLIVAASSYLLVLRLNQLLSEIWQAPERTRNVIFLWFIMIFLPVLANGALVLTTAVESLGGQYVGLTSSWLLEWLPEASLLFFLAVVYRLTANVKIKTGRLVILVIAIGLIMMFSARHFIQLLLTSPSLQLMTRIQSALPLLLFWVYWNALIVLLGGLILRYWHIGPLLPVRLLTWDQLLDCLKRLNQPEGIEWQGCQDLGISQHNWQAFISMLQEGGWTEATGKNRYRLREPALERHLDELWAVISFRTPNKHDPVFRIFDSVAGMSLKQLVERL